MIKTFVNDLSQGRVGNIPESLPIAGRSHGVYSPDKNECVFNVTPFPYTIDALLVVITDIGAYNLQPFLMANCGT